MHACLVILSEAKDLADDQRECYNTGVPRDKTYYIYIMTNQSGTLYTGVTGDLKRRIWLHRTNPDFPDDLFISSSALCVHPVE